MSTRTASTDIEGLVKRAARVADRLEKVGDMTHSPETIRHCLREGSETLTRMATALRDIDEARKGAVVPASSPAGGDVWRTMESAPRDGRWFAILDTTEYDVIGESPWWIGTARFERPADGEPEMMLANGYDKGPIYPTHWAPLAALSPSLPAKGDSFVASASLDGWKLVPVEPDEAVIEAIRVAWRNTRTQGVSGMTIDAQWRAEYAREFAVYRAMLSAAPTPPNCLADATQNPSAKGERG